MKLGNEGCSQFNDQVTKNMLAVDVLWGNYVTPDAQIDIKESLCHFKFSGTNLSLM